MPIIWKQTKQEKIEVMEWAAGVGEHTAAVADAITRNGLTFGAALITRKFSDNFPNN